MFKNPNIMIIKTVDWIDSELTNIQTVNKTAGKTAHSQNNFKQNN